MVLREKWVGIVKYPGVQLAAVYGLTDMFLTANSFIDSADVGEGARFAVSHWEPAHSGTGLRLDYASSAPPATQQNVIIVPGSLVPGNLEVVPSSVSEWIRAQYTGGAVASSVCKGVYALARSGILRGRRVTTHWSCLDEFSRLHPDVSLEIDKIIVDDGEIITAGGVMAWMDLGLKLIHKFAGSGVMIDVAKFLLIDPSGRKQKCYRAFSPPTDHGDEKVLRVQHWLQAHFGENLSLARMAHVAATSERTLIRRFHNALGMSPTTYVQKLRTGKARELLELTRLPFNQVSWKVGYEDIGAFRKVFLREMGLTPAQYRRKFYITEGESSD